MADPRNTVTIARIAGKNDTAALYPQWTAKLYNEGEEVKNGTPLKVYHCLAQHTGVATTLEPGEGSDWEEYWDEIEVGELRNSRNFNITPTDTATTRNYMGSPSRTISTEENLTGSFIMRVPDVPNLFFDNVGKDVTAILTYRRRGNGTGLPQRRVTARFNQLATNDNADDEELEQDITFSVVGSVNDAVQT